MSNRQKDKREEKKPSPFGQEAVYGCPSKKVGWHTRAAAKRVQKRAKRAQSDRRVVTVYQCHIKGCELWHMTSQDRRSPR
jgi:hypothetical protein